MHSAQFSPQVLPGNHLRQETARTRYAHYARGLQTTTRMSKSERHKAICINARPLRKSRAVSRKSSANPFLAVVRVLGTATGEEDILLVLRLNHVAACAQMRSCAIASARC